CAFPLAFFHRIAGDYIDSDTLDVEFQIGMFGITIDCLSANALANRREDLLSPLLPIHRSWKAGEDVQVGFATQPGVPRVRPLNRDVASNARLGQDALNLFFQCLSQSRHSCPFSLTWNDFLRNLVQDRLN